MPVTEAIIAITSRCNAKCAMCEMWRRDPGDEVEPSYYYRLPQSLRNVNITGGEPFMRKDIAQIVTVISDRCRGVRPVISSNGFLTSRILEAAPKLLKINPRTAFRISIDGIGNVHDEIRGIRGGFEKAAATLKGLRKLGAPDLGIGFTLVRGNEREMMRVFQMSRQLGVQFTSTVAHSSPIFFGDQDAQTPDVELARTAFRDLKKAQLRLMHPKNWFRAYFTEGVIDMLEGRKRRIVCPALEAFFFLDPHGIVFPCHILDSPLGKLTDAPFEELVEGHPEILKQVRTCPEHCWMTCTVAPQMKREIVSVTNWAIRSKIAAHTGWGSH